MAAQQTANIPLNRSHSLPAGGATSYSAPLNNIEFPGTDKALFYVDVPAFTVTQLANGQTVAFSLVEGNDPTFAGVVSTTAMGTVAGAGGVGSKAVTLAARPALVGGQYFGLKAVASASAAVSSVSVNLGVAKT